MKAEQLMTLLNTKEYETAFKLLNSGPLEDRPESEYEYYLGICNVHLQQYEKALTHLQRVCNQNSDPFHLFQSRMIRGFIYTILQQYRMAELEFNQLLNKGFISSRIYAALGHVLYRQGKIKPSLGALEQALELDPNYAGALNSMGYILAEEKIKLTIALEYCNRCCTLQPNNPAYLDSLGWVNYLLGNVETSLSILRKAHVLSPNHPEINAHLQTVERNHLYK